MSETRVILYGGKKLPVPDGVSLDQAKQLMARHFPELADPEVKSEKKDDVTTWTFSKKAGRKGLGTLSTLARELEKIEPLGIEISPEMAGLARRIHRGQYRRHDQTLAEFFEAEPLVELAHAAQRVAAVRSALSALSALPTDERVLL